MRRLAILVPIFLLSFSPAALAGDDSLPICADTEFVEFFNMIVAHQLEFDGDITSANMLNRVTGTQMERRQDYQSPAPQCADAIAIQRLLIQLGGDALARAALELADVPAADNPYQQRLPDDQARIDALLSAMLAVDRSAVPAAEQREATPCQPEDWALLDKAAAALLSEVNSASDDPAPSEALAAIDRLLVWREETIPTLPTCAEAIDLIQAMSATATDSAAYQAHTYGGVSADRNPFSPLLEAALATVALWREPIPASAAGQAVASSARAFSEVQLPSCSDAELADTFEELQAEFADLLKQADQAESKADLADYAEAQIAFRDTRLAELPLCLEALETRWWAAEALADAALRSAFKGDRSALIARRQGAAMDRNKARASSSWANLESALAGDDDGPITPVGKAAECTEADRLFLFVYLLPEFWELTDAALALSQPGDIATFIDQSYAFRRVLWANLPRCNDALEMGFIMRSVAADAAAMLALELARAPLENIAYLPKIAGGIERFFEWTEQFNETCGNLDGPTMTYYVVAENFANIRSCAATSCSIVATAQRGQGIDVVDNSSNWHELILPSCETGYIAAFLASQTPPAG